jgi:hypothetical protein
MDSAIADRISQRDQEISALKKELSVAKNADGNLQGSINTTVAALGGVILFQIVLFAMIYSDK